MLILHFALTPLVGAPLRLCRALSLLPGVQARVVVLDPGAYTTLRFEDDLVWARDRDEVIELAERADVLHLHNYLHLDSHQFAPIDFRVAWREGRALVRQFHSQPGLVSRMSGESLEEIQACPIPKLVIAQFQERFYPAARVVPNLVDLGAAMARRDGDPLRINYSPSNFRTARSERWDTKSYRETRLMLREVQRRARAAGQALEIDVVEGVPHIECLARKAAADIAIDDLVTGSYHMSTLESLALGNLVLTYMDSRVVRTLAGVTGRDDFPALNVPLETAAEVLLELAREPALVRELGRASRAWMMAHWAPERLATLYLEIYHEVLRAPHAGFAPRFALNSAAERYANIGIYDALWRARHAHWPAEPPDWYTRARVWLWERTRGRWR